MEVDHCSFVNKSGCMLEHPSIRRYSSAGIAGSDNPCGAGNQQERPRFESPRFAESSEAIRRTTSEEVDEMVRSPRRRGEPGGRETTWPLAAQAAGVTAMNGPKVAKFLVG